MSVANLLLLACLVQDAEAPQSPPVVRVATDDVAITESCTVVFDAAPILDDEGDGVLHVTGDGVTIEFEGELRGAPDGVLPDAYAGFGIVVTGDGVTLRGARASGYSCAIRVTGASDVVLEDCDVSDNFRQRLRSTPEAEDGADWLWPHANDDDEWLEQYGAGIWAEDCTNLKVRRCRARDGQNGLILVRTNDSEVYDCDFSFLSGWGIALWRSSNNTITRNALDFCIRGYSHGVYNRGQDSAGVLLFEQCNRNVFAENSATHGGDGFFGFAGKEALGETPPPTDDFDYARRGCNGNVLWGNDFSYAAAHGIELTFSFDNVFARNRLVGNAICGVWGGYSRDTRILSNELRGNGDAGYGLERGGVNVEHAGGIEIVANSFADNACGVHLWWDEDAHFTELPWMRANGMACAENTIAANAFEGDAVGLHLRDCTATRIAGNTFTDVASEIEREGEGASAPLDGSIPALPLMSPPHVNGETRPVGARAHLAGRENILMTEWGPYDHEGLYPQQLPSEDSASHHWRILGTPQRNGVDLMEGCRAFTRLSDEGELLLQVRATSPGGVARYRVWFAGEGDERVEASGVIVDTKWTVTSFPWTVDPREDAHAWRAEAEQGVTYELPRLDLAFGMGGPSQLRRAPEELANQGLAPDRFGTLARTKVLLPAGRWTIATTSDDGLRVFVDDDLLIDDWTWHAPKRIDAELTLDRARTVEIRVEHFELDGFATLQVELEPAR